MFRVSKIAASKQGSKLAFFRGRPKGERDDGLGGRLSEDLLLLLLRVLRLHYSPCIRHRGKNGLGARTVNLPQARTVLLLVVWYTAEKNCEKGT